jgi:hypothetical protein
MQVAAVVQVILLVLVELVAEVAVLVEVQLLELLTQVAVAVVFIMVQVEPLNQVVQE